MESRSNAYIGGNLETGSERRESDSAACGGWTRRDARRSDQSGRALGVNPVDLDIVTQHLEIKPADGFDLIVATNVFAYFDSFEQLLAMANAETMLRPGGYLLSNNMLPLLPSIPMRWLNNLSILYSGRPNDGDVIAWYQRLPE